MMICSLVYPICGIILCILAVIAEICPPDWHRYGESCYFIIMDKMDWYEANRTCAESQANLAVPNSKSEQDYIWELFLKEFNPMPFADLWIGCNDIEEEGKWQYCPLKFETNGYENWADMEPNDHGGEDCGTMKFFVNGKWDDKPCSQYSYCAVCELPITSTPVFCLQTSDDGHLPFPKCMLHHIMEELPGKSFVSCGKACRAHPQCRSFNLLEQGEGKMVCQLNNKTRHEASVQDMVETNEKCYLFDL